MKLPDIIKIPDTIKRSKELKKTDAWAGGTWIVNTVPCIPYQFRNEQNLAKYSIQVEEYIVEQCSYEIKDGVIILPEEFEYSSDSGFKIPDKYNRFHFHT